jgi:hypothetical protein
MMRSANRYPTQLIVAPVAISSSETNTASCTASERRLAGRGDEKLTGVAVGVFTKRLESLSKPAHIAEPKYPSNPVKFDTPADDKVLTRHLGLRVGFQLYAGAAFRDSF